MVSYFFAIPLPVAIRSQLANFCCGLPQVQWVDKENLHLTLSYFGPLNDQMLNHIQDRLENLFFYPFSLVLQGLDHSHTKSNQGTIWIGIAHNLNLNSLKKEIDRQLRDLHLSSKEYHFHPHVTLGYYHHLNPQRLGDYLAIHANYQSCPIEVSSCSLMRSFQTPKRIIYETIDEYSASQFHINEDDT